MKSKIYKILLTITCIQIFFYACCATDQYNIFITSIQLTAQDTNDNDASIVSNQNFNLLLDVNFDSELISSFYKKSGLITTANAISCLDDYVVSNPVSTLTIEANVPLFNIDAGESLNTHVLVNDMFSTDNTFATDELLFLLNNERDTNVLYFLRFDNAIPADTVVKFTITLNFENGDTLQSTTADITFQ